MSEGKITDKQLESKGNRGNPDAVHLYGKPHIDPISTDSVEFSLYFKGEDGISMFMITEHRRGLLAEDVDRIFELWEQAAADAGLEEYEAEKPDAATIPALGQP